MIVNNAQDFLKLCETLKADVAHTTPDLDHLKAVFHRDDIQHIVIFGKENCPHCLSAKTTAENLMALGNLKEMTYCDVLNLGLERDVVVEEISNVLGYPLRTVPRIFIKQQDDAKFILIGGNDDFQAFLKENL